MEEDSDYDMDSPKTKKTWNIVFDGTWGEGIARKYFFRSSTSSTIRIYLVYDPAGRGAGAHEYINATPSKIRIYNRTAASATSTLDRCYHR